MRKGFTLIELIVVIAIIAILAAIIAPNAFKAIEKASRSATLGDWRTMKTASMAFYADTGTWPANNCEEALLSNRNNTTVAGCVAVAAGTNGISGWDGPYIEQWPSRTRWGGVYNLSDTNDLNWDGADNNDAAATEDQGRYIKMNLTPTDVAGRLDEQVDGGVVNAACDASGDDCGQHRWNGTASEFMLISTDVAVLN